MDSKRKRRGVELLKDLLILALALSALYLLGRTQLYSEGPARTGWLSSVLSLFPSGEPEPSGQPVGGWGGGGVIRPARVVLSGPAGRYGVQYSSERVQKVFGELTNPLADALAAAGSPERSSFQAWRRALSGEEPCVYLDFLGEVPLADLSSWLSGGRAPSPSLTGRARRLLLTVDGKGAVLYYINEPDGMYYACRSDADIRERLEALVTSDAYPFNSPRFAYEDQEQYGDLAPHTLLGVLEANRPTFTAANPVLQTDLAALTAVLGFHPQTYASYPVSEGVAVHEGGDKLTVGNDGTVDYVAAEGGEPRYPIAGSGAEWEMVDGAWAFVERTVGPLCGDAHLYLLGTEAEEGGGAWVLFGYQLEGAAVRLGGEDACARVLVRDGAIAAYSLKLRTYTATGQTSVVMQEAQALGALRAMEAEGSELALCYWDQGGDLVAAGWCAQ